MARLTRKQIRLLKSAGQPQDRVTGFNVKLRKKEVIQNPRKVTLSNGRKAIAGVGSDGTKIFRFIKG